MIRIAELQAKALRDLDHGRELSTTKVIVPPGSEFDNPTLGQIRALPPAATMCPLNSLS